MIGVEFDMVVTDSLKALELYESIFDVEQASVASFKKGQNEAIFTMYGTRFHLMDENPSLALMAPSLEGQKSMWCNINVPDIAECYQKAVQAGCVEVQPPTESPEFSVINAMLTDPFGYLWMLNEITREISFEERCRILKEQNHE